MSSLHPHWQATDDGVPVPVRIAVSKSAPTNVPVGTKTVSRRPAAIVGILMAFSIGAVAYGTLDDARAPLAGELMDVENPTTYFDVLAEQMVRASVDQNRDTAPETAEVPTEDSIVYRRDLEPSIPVNPSTYNTLPAELAASLPVNQNVIGANVTETFHSGAPGPVEQPQTGAGMLWATILGAVAVLFWQSREKLKAIVE
ncbi:hypothetical protein A3C37_01260 [Candidatus Peribacteria bacterium RIFCSPHIGHO2_02_FULL_53_20]|nr:MAG: hypothetical protein A3C37_01260 [Candidatus Peribacteria bacterium RIFCSPHIGHO2_02_FULL_53_20]OGJ68294.1 MAG: hypothetical protein A3B61_01680 [Candidatus Peribacteria bacterium RIFCSPLOWO2_01_FULL_53_10]OGJ73637.1 MAG: hypothetical protein A3G69_00605 [Candidatus Peribacteria bacterium RIFCSPLOWO2_12_FULL_53_10]